MTTILLDTHVLHWWAVEPERVAPAAAHALETADELVVAAISWWELAWLVTHGRVAVRIPLATWLGRLAREVRTAPITPAIAAAAAELPESFPSDPADRLIYATAVEHGWQLVTKDRHIRNHDRAGAVAIW